MLSDTRPTAEGGAEQPRSQPAPDQQFVRPESAARYAHWWSHARGGSVSGSRRTALVPACLPSVVRVLHPWRDTDHAGVPWLRVALRAGHPDRDQLLARAEASGITTAIAGYAPPVHGLLDTATGDALATVLRDHTAAGEVFGALTEGGDPDRWRGAARITADGERLRLVRGPLDRVVALAAARGREAAGSHGPPVARAVWPRDRSWLLQTRPSWPWTLVAGSRSLVIALRFAMDLEVVDVELADDAPVGPDEPSP